MTASQDSTKARPAAPAVRSQSPDVTRAASIVGLFGATGSGKSTIIKRTLAARSDGRPCMVFDAGHEYEGGDCYTVELEFLKACDAMPALPVFFRPSFDVELRGRQFDRFCAAGLAVARARGGCLVVVEELQRVTLPGWAPPHWRELIETGRKFGASIVAASQRPAMIDKGFFSNATMIRTGRLNFADDQATLAACLGVDKAAIAALAGQEYIERDLLAGTPAKPGKLTF